MPNKVWDFFLFKFDPILKQSKTCWQLEAVQSVVNKGREITDHKQAALYAFSYTKIFPQKHKKYRFFINQ